MAITVTPLLTTLSTCDTANWSGGTLDTGVFKQGTGSLSASVSNTTSVVYYYTLPSTDFTGQHYYVWMMNITRLDTQANGGLRMYMYCANGAYRTWFVGGSDTYSGGWQCFVVDPNNTTFVGEQAGTFDITQITRVGVQFKTLQSIKAGLITSYWDAARYGSGLRVTSASTDTITLDNIYAVDDSTANAYGIISKNNGVYYLQGELIFGSTTAGQHISFSDKNQIIVFKDQPVSTSLYRLKVEGNSTGTINFQLGSSSGTGTDTLGFEGVNIKTASSSLPYGLDFADPNIDVLKLYGSNFINPSTVSLGSSAAILGGSGSTIDLVDNAFTSPTQVVRNISSSATKIQLRNKVTFATSATASLDLYDSATTPSDEWTIVGSTASGFGSGFVSTATGTQTLNISNHNFNQIDKPYINLESNETWNSINPLWTITNQVELNFGGSTLTGAQVNEKFEVGIDVQQPDGTKIESARIKLIEASPSPSISDQVNSDSNGSASFEKLRRTYIGAASNALTTTTYSNFALKVYKYGRGAFAGAVTIDSAINPGITLLPDSFQIQTNQATAITLGDTTHNVQIQEQTNSATLLKFTSGSDTLSVGNTVSNSSNGATGVVASILEGNSSEGTILLNSRNATAWPTSAHTLSNGSGWSATFTTGTVRNFKWLINADTLSLQQLYDYLNAKLADSTLDITKHIDDIVLWGRAEQAIPLQGDGSKFKTVRNAALSQGWAVYNFTDIGLLSVFTDDSNNLFSPETTVPIQITIVDVTNTPIQTAQVAIYQTNDNLQLLNTTTDINGQVSTSLKYTANIPIYVRVRKSSTGATKYIPVSSSGTIGSTGFSATITLIQDTTATT